LDHLLRRHHPLERLGFINWAPQQVVPNVWTSVGPRLAVFNGQLYMAWKGEYTDQGIWWTSFDGTNWAPQQQVPGVGTSPDL
jgi:hypothetical protein